MLRGARYLVMVALFAVVAPPCAKGQRTPLTEEQIASLISRKASKDAILTVSHDQCIDFVVDERHKKGLLSESGDSALVSGLSEACYIGSALEITADRPGATVSLAGRQVGAAPWRGPVSAPDHVVILVEQGSWSQRVSVDLKKGQYVRVAFHMPVDTLPVPPSLSPAQLAQLAADTAVFTPRSARPIAPVRPTSRSTLAGTVIGALVGGAAGAGVGYAACKTTSPVESPSQLGGYNASHSTTSSINGGCVAGAGGGGLLVGGIVGNLISRAQYGGKLRRYQHDSTAYAGLLASWQQQNASDSARAISDKRQKYHDEQAKVDRARQIVQLNTDARARNTKLAGPEITVEPAHQLPRAGASF